MKTDILSPRPVIAEPISVSMLQYEGAFTLPAAYGEGSGWQCHYKKDSNTLYVGGYGRSYKVGEISIPQPVNSLLKDYQDLNEATLVQPLVDPTNGLNDQVFFGSGMIGGMTIHNGSLYTTTWQYYNVNNENYPGLGKFNLLGEPQRSEGMYYLNLYGEPLQNNQVAGPMCVLPEGLIPELGSKRMLSCGPGPSMRTKSKAPWGPSVYAFDPDNLSQNNEVFPLAHFNFNSQVQGLTPNTCQYCDYWASMAYVEKLQSILIMGVKGKGSCEYAVGWGYYCDPYEVQFYRYPLTELQKVARGEIQPHEIRPQLMERNLPWVWAPQNLPGQQQPVPWLEGMGVDQERGRIFVPEIAAYYSGSNFPIIHVFKTSVRVFQVRPQ